MLLSATLIVRNEERFLDACLCSLHDAVDEIVVVDTGSTDESPDIARAHGARLHHFTWIDDFAAARNEALAHARGRFVLYIDADETVRAGSRAELEPLLRAPGAIAYWVMLHPRPGHTPYREVRVFRNDPRLRFRHAIHENIWPAINRVRAREGGTIGQSPLVLEHHGYEGDQHAKHLRNVPLLRQVLADDPTVVFNWCHLARIQAALGDAAGAEEAWGRALALVRGRRHPPATDALPYTGLVSWRMGRGEDAWPLLEEGLGRFPDNLQLRCHRGRLLMARGQFAEAIRDFEWLLERAAAGDLDPTVSYDARLLDLFPVEGLAHCHFKLGAFAAAREWFVRAAALAPDVLEYRIKRDLCARLAQGHGPGVKPPHRVT